MPLRIKCIVWASVAAVALVTAPASSEACGRCWGRQPAATYSPMTVNYAPIAVAPACTSCAPCTTCVPACGSCAPACNTCAPTTTYMPVTAYRTVLRPVTVTAYSPVRSGCCLFGGGTTTYRPVTGIVYRPQMVAYTSYRPVMSIPVATTSLSPCSTCAATSTTYRIGDTYSTWGSTAPSCPTCISSASQLPVVSSAPAAAPTTSAPATAAPTPTYAPTPAPAQTTPPATRDLRVPTDQPEQKQEQKPAAGTNTSTNPLRLPQVAQPSPQPLLHQAVYVRPVPPTASAPATAAPALDVSGWHAAK